METTTIISLTIISFMVGLVTALAIAWHYVGKLKAGGDKALLEELKKVKQDNWSLENDNYLLKLANQTMFNDGVAFGKITKGTVEEMIADHKRLNFKILKTEKGHPLKTVPFQIQEQIQEKNMKSINKKQTVEV